VRQIWLWDGKLLIIIIFSLWQWWEPIKQKNDEMVNCETDNQPSHLPSYHQLTLKKEEEGEVWWKTETDEVGVSDWDF